MIAIAFNHEGAPDPVFGTLVIHQNLSGPSTDVQITATGGTGDDPNLSWGAQAICRIEDDGVLAVELPIVVAGPGGDGAAKISISVQVNEGSTATLTASMDTQTVARTFTLEAPESAFKAKFAIDPQNEVVESDETDNRSSCTFEAGGP
ncbi:MAG: hypothetical protein AVDCRST_MAG66-2432 [uncultured Pseudonocardia sp.]|uniref:CARDB domain-containing protein n=1 Tax=uncultured Pseudonocardia sp. TaxID=211455 RepID=A0A6J4PQD7_9PSEU|nr:MAG: hypothetical protein AVDCRST_MAG66-2432 [uncultured Pseudonocardia sp.]